MGFIICLYTKEDKFKYVPIGSESQDLETDDKANELVKASVGSTSD